MLSVREANQRLRDSARPLRSTEEIELARATGRVLAESIVSGLDVPPADNSAMDGYALRHADWPGENASLPVSQRIAAGMPPGPLATGSTARIFTGAEIPEGADTVVMQEDTEPGENSVRISRLPVEGANIRPRGQDIHAGQAVLEPGCRLFGPELGLLASIGRARVKVRRKLRVAILSNGDELVEPGHAVGPGQIYNSNRYMLRGLVDGWGFEVVDLGIAPDDAGEITRLLEQAADQADVILTSGGVSVGEEDHIKNVVEALGGIDFWKIAVKPGKPLAFGQVRDTPFIGLPGNPASALVTCLIFARPFLFAMAAMDGAEVEPVAASAGFSSRGSAREEYLRARCESGSVNLYPNQSSGVLLSSVWGNGLVIKLVGQDIKPGDTVDFLPWGLLR